MPRQVTSPFVWLMYILRESVTALAWRPSTWPTVTATANRKIGNPVASKILNCNEMNAVTGFAAVIESSCRCRRAIGRGCNRALTKRRQLLPSVSSAHSTYPFALATTLTTFRNRKRRIRCRITSSTPRPWNAVGWSTTWLNAQLITILSLTGATPSSPSTVWFGGKREDCYSIVSEDPLVCEI